TDSMSTPEPASDASDAAVEADPEVVRLKKELRKAQLERQIADARNMPIGCEPRIDAVEKAIDQLIECMTNGYGELKDKVDSCPLSGLRESFRCSSCGKKGLLAAKIVCTACETEELWGWHPDEAT
ncbi:MAG: hypothetical protein NTU41_01915, partial [Chloroflexi bacterium]|nr:hypothetical protein [Chloroflexota bacterium]